MEPTRSEARGLGVRKLGVWCNLTPAVCESRDETTADATAWCAALTSRSRAPSLFPQYAQWLVGTEREHLVLLYHATTGWVR